MSRTMPCPHCGQPAEHLQSLVDGGGTYWLGCLQCWQRLSYDILRPAVRAAVQLACQERAFAQQLAQFGAAPPAGADKDANLR